MCIKRINFIKVWIISRECFFWLHPDLPAKHITSKDKLAQGLRLKLAPMMPPCGHEPLSWKYRLLPAGCMPAFQWLWKTCSPLLWKVIVSCPPCSHIALPLQHPACWPLEGGTQLDVVAWSWAMQPRSRLCPVSARRGTNRFQEASHMISGSQWVSSKKAAVAKTADVCEGCIGSSGDLQKSVQDLYS